VLSELVLDVLAFIGTAVAYNDEDDDEGNDCGIDVVLKIMPDP
jgi:hypothetical protein